MPRLRWNCPQPISKPLDLLHRVIVHRANAHHLAFSFQSQPLGDHQRVIVAVPDKNALLAQHRRNVPWMAIPQVNDIVGTRSAIHSRSVMSRICVLGSVPSSPNLLFGKK